MSGEFVRLMRKTSIQLCRRIDKCTIKPLTNPVEVWTFDTNLDRNETENTQNENKLEEEGSMNNTSLFNKAKNYNEDNINLFANQMMLTTNNEQEGDNMMNNLKIENEQLF